MLRLTNKYNVPVFAMVEWLHRNCPDGGDWIKKGWWRLEPNQTKIAYPDDCDEVNLWWYSYAYARDGSRFWAGNFPETVPSEAFEWCEFVSSTTAREIGMFEFAGGQSAHHEVTFR